MEEIDVTCISCLCIYENPYTLPCLHTYCRRCIDKKGTEKLRFKCPQCHAICDIKTIKFDFKMQKFVENYWKNQETSEENKIPLRDRRCEVCKNNHNAITCKCLECNQLLCANCEMVHKGLSITKLHRIAEINLYMSQVKDHLEKAKRLLQEEKGRMIMSINMVSDNILSLLDIKSQQHDELNRLKMRLHQEIEQKCREKHETIDRENNREIEKLNSVRNTAKSQIIDIDNSLELLNCLFRADDIFALNQAMCTIDSEIIPNIKEMQATQVQMKAAREAVVESPVIIIAGRKLDPKILPQVLINPLDTPNTGDQSGDTNMVTCAQTDKSVELQAVVRPEDTSNSQLAPERRTDASDNLHMEAGEMLAASCPSPESEEKHTELNLTLNANSQSQGMAARSMSTICEENQAVLSEETVDSCEALSVFSRILNSTYTCAKQVKLQRKARHMCLVKDELWLADDSDISIFSKDLEFVRNIHHDKLTNSLCHNPDNGHVIVAHGRAGLVQYSEAFPHYSRHVADGFFSDVYWQGSTNQLYALTYQLDESSPLILIFTNEGHNYTEINVISLNLPPSSELPDNQDTSSTRTNSSSSLELMHKVSTINLWQDCGNRSCDKLAQEDSTTRGNDKLLVHDSDVYLSSWSGCQVLKYNIHKQSVVQRLGEKASDGKWSAGTMLWPRLCGVDGEGRHVMVADYGHKTIQVYCRRDSHGAPEPPGEWKVLDFDCDIRMPVQAAVDEASEEGGTDMWMICEDAADTSGRNASWLCRFTKK